jgi:hypothetical protein
MADFAPNFTPRLKLAYQCQSARHATTWRLPIGTARTEVAPFVAKMSAFLQSLAGNLFNDWAVTATTFAEGGSDIFLPVSDVTQPTASSAITGRQPGDKANYIQFVGRGEDGARASFYIYGTYYRQDTVGVTDFRIHNAEDAVISAATGILNETPPTLVAIDDSLVIWYPYVNFKSNDHWVHKVRAGT